MKSNKLLSLLMAAVMTTGTVATLAACGGGTPDPKITGIEVTTAPTKVKYVVGEKFDPTGMVVSKVYDNETTEAIPAAEYTYAPTAALKVSDKKVTIKWSSESDEEYTCDQKITVSNDITKVDVVTPATKTEYIAGEKFDPAGMTIKATYEDGTSEDAVTVTDKTVTYKTSGLVKSDEHFEMVYGGFTFYYDISVAHGAFVEAEDGTVKGAQIASAGPSEEAIAKDYVNYLGNVEDAQGHRGIDEGAQCADVGITDCYKGGCKIDGGRVDMRSYVYGHLDWTETTGGKAAKSGMIQNNHVSFPKGGQMIYKLTADKAGKVAVTFKIANPHFDPDSSSKAVETKLNEVIKLTVGSADFAIPDTVKLAAVDWSMYHSYNNERVKDDAGVRAKTGVDFAVKNDPSKYTGALCKPIYYWQNVTVEINVVAGVNNLVIESIWDGDVKLDSLSCNADADEITISLKSELKPAVKTAQLKVEGGKVLMGVIVDAQAVGFTDEEVVEFLKLTNIANVNNAEYGKLNSDGTNKEGNVGKLDQDNDPWWQTTDNGGLGYTQASPGFTSGKSYYDKITKLEKVEKITEGANAGLYVIWYEVTNDSDDYLGVWGLTQFNYGTNFAENQPDQDLLKTAESVTAELNGYCYQLYCDSRDDNITFGWGNLCIVVQKGTFVAANATADLPLRNMLMRRYISHFEDNDQELIDLRKPQA